MEWKYTIGEMEENTCQELANSIVKLLDCSNFFTARQYTNLRIENEQLTKFTKLTTVTFPTKNYGDIIVKTINHTITDGYGTQCDIIIGGPDGKQFSVDYNPISCSDKYFAFNYMVCDPEDPEYATISEDECIIKDLRLLCEAVIEAVNFSATKPAEMNLYMLQYTLDFLDMVELGEFGLDDFIDCYDSFYYSAHTHAHYFDDPEPRPNPYKDPEFDEEFWEAVENRMEK